MNEGIDTEIRDAFEEYVIRKQGLTPEQYFELGVRFAEVKSIVNENFSETLEAKKKGLIKFYLSELKYK